jgi:hypothetical protein
LTTSNCDAVSTLKSLLSKPFFLREEPIAKKSVSSSVVPANQLNSHSRELNPDARKAGPIRDCAGFPIILVGINILFPMLKASGNAERLIIKRPIKAVADSTTAKHPVNLHCQMLRIA